MLRPLVHNLERWSPIRSPRRSVNFLRVLWILALLHGEYLIFLRAAWQCRPWPHRSNTSADGSLDRLLLVGDPQLTDRFSYDRAGILLRISEFYSDMYMRRNYRLLDRWLRPHATVFMGDLMDGGREWKDDARWYEEAARFRRVFASDKPQYFMVGNHDIGFGNGIQEHVLDRFQAEYGPTSYIFKTSHYSIIVIDTVSLSATKDLASKRQALDVLKQPLPPHPRIMFTHVPLYRPDNTFCGQDRQHASPIRQGRGYQYQNLVDQRLSSQLLEHIKPVAVFSGDDHDYCAVWHRLSNGRDQVIEVSVPTFSMAQGLLYPGVMLLDLSPSSTGEDYLATKLCWLPNQIAIFMGYAYLAVCSIIALAAVHLIRHRRQQSLHGKELPTPYNVRRRSKDNGFVKDVIDVATVGIAVYIFCILFL